jgi:tetratricopeptide (TPR) repeat protein
MKITEDNKYELIDSYISGQMDYKDVQEFESIIKNDDNLQAELSLIKELHEFQEFSVQEANLKATLNTIRNNPKPKGNVIKFLILFAIAACIFFLFHKTLNQGSVSDSYGPIAMVEPLEIITKADNNFKDLRVMQDLYNSKEYKSAYPYLLSYLQSNPGDLDVILAKGIALMEMQKFSDAQDVFSQIEALNPRVKKYKWYMAINYIKEGQKEKAKSLLNEIQAEKSYNHDKVSQLLETIK